MPSPDSGNRAAVAPAWVTDEWTGSKRRALAMITTETSSSQAPKPFFKVFGFTLFVMLAPIRALITAVTAMAPAARSDAKPSWM